MTTQPLLRCLGRWLERLPSFIAAVILFCLMVMTFADVMMRSLFNLPFAATTELTKLAIAIIVFTSLPIVSMREKHITVDLLDFLYNPLAAQIRNSLINLICGALLIWPAYRVWELAQRAMSYGDVTEYLHIPTYLIAALIACFSALAASALILKALSQFYRLIVTPTPPATPTITNHDG